jgi:mRNA-degrading endonuclease toxin of MazEF toxin-antitoxin module
VVSLSQESPRLWAWGVSSPVLVIQEDDLQTGLPQVIVAMITSKMFRANHPSWVAIALPQGIRSGLSSSATNSAKT